MCVVEIVDRFNIKVKDGFSFEIKDHDKILNEIPFRKTGVYILFDKNKKPLYVGKTEKLKPRLKSHFLGSSVATKDYLAEMKYCSLIILNASSSSLEWLETFLIQEYKPSLNIHKNKSRWKMLFRQKYQHRCKGTTLKQDTCRSFALENGYCRIHGGQGKKWDVLVDEEMREIGF